MKIIKTTLATLIILFAAVSALAQDRKPIPQDEQSMYVVSAKAGVINLIEGDVSYMRDKAAWSKLTSGDELREGDTVKTGANSRAEVLLTPGCYLRLAENTGFVLSDTSVNKFKIEILEGSALIEASVIEDPMTVATPKTEFSIIRKGLYRFNVSNDGKAEAAVRKGRINVGQTFVKGDKKAIYDNGTLAIASYGKKDTDSFDQWSKDRSKTLIAANRNLSNRNIDRRALFGFVSNVWIRDSRCGCYTFLPFGYGFSSPYGGDYAVCNPFWYSYRPRPGYGNGYGNGSGSGGGSGGGNHGGYPGKGGGGGGGVTPRPSEPPPRFDPGERGRWSDGPRERPQPVNNGGHSGRRP
ncbi:MAG: FecR family protein [Blastocatellia bacterium]